MKSGYEIAEVHQQQQQQFMAEEFSSMNQNGPYHNHHHHQIFQPVESILVTQQSFQHQHQVRAFYEQQQYHQEQQRRLDQQPCLEREPGRQTIGNVSDGATDSLPFFAVNFKLGLNESSDNNRDDVVLNEGEQNALLHGSEQHVQDCQPTSLVMPHCWQNQEDPAIKAPFWKPLYEEFLNRNNNRCIDAEDKEEVLEEKENKHFKYSKEAVRNDRGKDSEYKCRLFGELESIYSHVGGHVTNLTGSGSALTVENSPKNAKLPTPFNDPNCLNVTAAATIGVDHGSEASFGEEASLRKVQKRKKRKKMKDQLSSVANFFENMVKQLRNHQEVLHRKFLEVIERLDQQRKEREEARRQDDIENFNRAAIARAHEQALASSREATIVSYLEKITGQSINLPNRRTPLQFQPVISAGPITESKSIDTINNVGTSNVNSRWPKAEVEALIRVRSSLESKFQEPGLKGPLWEEISNLMATMGYQRSAKRCKEKWENINKYFKKTKESLKQRPQQSRTCPYFEQLDQLYSKSFINGSSSSSSSYCSKLSVGSDVGVQRKSNSDLLDAIIAGTELGTAQSLLSMTNFRVDEMEAVNLEFNGSVDDKVFHQGGNGKEIENYEEVKDKGEDAEGNEGVEEENQEVDGDDVDEED